MWLAALGVNVKLTGNALGRDSYGDMVMEGLRNYPNIDLSLVEQRERVTMPLMARGFFLDAGSQICAVMAVAGHADAPAAVSAGAAGGYREQMPVSRK